MVQFAGSRGWWCTLTLLLLCGANLPCQAQTTTNVAAPPKFSPTAATVSSVPDALRVVVDPQVISAGGYHPIHIELIPLRPSAALRRFRVRLITRENYRDQGLTVSQEVDLPPGTAPARLTLRLPMIESYNDYLFQLDEDGEWLPNLDMRNAFPGIHTPWADRLPAMLFVGPAGTIVDTGGFFEQARLGGETHYWNNPPATVNGRSQLPGTRVVPVPALPTHWLDYSAFDIVCISYADLQRVAQQHPERWLALRDWVRTGGNLCVFSLGSSWKELPALETLLGGFRPVPADVVNPLQRHWTAAPSTLPSMLPTDPSESYAVPEQMPSNNVQVTIPVAPKLPDEPPVATPGEAAASPDAAGPTLKCVGQPLDLGYVVVFRDAQWFVADHDSNWIQLLGLLTPERYRWIERNGISPGQGNTDLNEFLVPGTGKARVLEFQILITLFALFIGPVLYFWLRGQQRLHLLVLVVPTVSLTITAALFTYALLADGLGTKIRVRSVTELDMQQGRAATWGRLSYYTGLAPSSGLVFGGDQMVLPLRESDDYGRQIRARTLFWDDNQYLQRGWLQSRMPAQLVTQQAGPSGAKLEITTTPKLQVTNHLGTTIEMLVVSNDAGELFFAEQLAAGATKPLVSADVPMARWQKTLNAAAPALPDDYVDGSSYGFFRNRYYWNNGNQTKGSQSSGRMEETLRHAMFGVFKPRRFAAWCTTNPHVKLGLEGTDVGSSHLITGNW